MVIPLVLPFGAFETLPRMQTLSAACAQWATRCSTLPLLLSALVCLLAQEPGDALAQVCAAVSLLVICQAPSAATLAFTCALLTLMSATAAVHLACVLPGASAEDDKVWLLCPVFKLGARLLATSSCFVFHRLLLKPVTQADSAVLSWLFRIPANDATEFHGDSITLDGVRRMRVSAHHTEEVQEQEQEHHHHLPEPAVSAV